MKSIKLIPNVVFKNGKEAVDYYVDLFGDVKVVEFHKFSKEFADSMHMNLPANFDYENSCMHATLEIFGQTLFLSDNTNTRFPSLEVGNMFSMCLTPNASFDAKGLFDRMISKGCTIIVPFTKQHWGASFGSIRDKYGIIWQINQSA